MYITIHIHVHWTKMMLFELPKGWGPIFFNWRYLISSGDMCPNQIHILFGNCQAQVQVPGQVPGQVQKVQELSTKDLDLG